MLMWQVCFLIWKARPWGPGPVPLHGRTHVGTGTRDHQGGWIETEVVFGVGYRRPKHLGDRSGGAVGHELEHDQSVAIGAASDLVEYTTHLRYRAADEASVGLCGDSR